MQPTTWQIRNFTIGTHTEPGKVGQGSERFAREVSGLRIDANGHLRPRPALKQFGDEMRTAVTGVASAQDYLLSLRADGTLWIRFAAAPSREWEVQFQTPLDNVQAAAMRGRLSVVGDFEDFAIVKAEGGSPFWIDMRIGLPSYLHAFRLGLPVPEFTPNMAYRTSGENDVSVIKQGFVYFYRWTYVRAFGDSIVNIRDGNFQHTGILFGGMESNPSAAIGRYRTIPSGTLKSFIDGDEQEVLVAQMGTQYDIIEFNDWQHADDPQITGIMLYQSEPVDALVSFQNNRVNVDGLQYRRIDYIPKGETSSWTGQSAGEDAWPDRPSLRFDNDVMPDTQRIHLYNDRIFCPTSKGLRFSDVDGTVLRLWAYPEVNAIARSGIVDCVEHRGVLLFGGPTDFHGLTGTSPFDFVVNRLGTTGPVSAHAMDVFRDTVAFVGAAGFYVTQGTEVQKVSDALDADFEDYQVIWGQCHMLPDDSLVFVVQQAQASGRPRLRGYHFDGGWFVWPRLSVRQLTRWNAAGVHVMVADESLALRELLWNLTDSTADDDGEDADDLIDWAWESERLNFGDERMKQFREFQLEGQALSVVPQREARWGLTRGVSSIRRAFGWRIGSQVFAIGQQLWGTASVAARVRLTIWIDEGRPYHEVFELRRDDNYPVRIPINRRGRSIRIRLEGRGHVHLRAMRILGVTR